MIKLNKTPRPDDICARMPLRLFRRGDVIVDHTGAEGWIEFWAEDATAIRAKVKGLSGRFYRITSVREKRTEREWADLSDQALAKELDELKSVTTEMLALRVKAWRLLDSEGGHVDVPVTMENARSLFSDDEHDLRELTSDWMRDNPDAFFPPKNASLSPTPNRGSRRPSAT